MKKILLVFAPLLLALATILTACGRADRYTEIIDVEPIVNPAVVADPPRDSRARNEATLATFQTVGDLQVMTFCGDFDQIIAFQHHQIMRQFDSQGSGGPQRGCSMFAVRTGRDGGLVGRNYDQQDSQVLAGWFFPVGGYASVALLPLRDLGYTPAEPFDPADPQHRRNLLFAPVMAIEGMNEKGVTVTLASLGRRAVTQDPERPSRFLIHLVREILDRAATVHEAVAIAESYNVFDNGREIISHHIFLADAHTGSAVLEWRDGVMHLVKDPGQRQVVTNTDMFEVPLEQRRRACDRYDTICDDLAVLDDPARTAPLTWQEAMDALADARQDNRRYDIDGQRLRVSTQWSAVFDTDRREVWLALGKDYGRIYRLPVRSAAAPSSAAGGIPPAANP